MTAIAGWYPDPSSPSELRFWDGQTWTAQTAPAVIAQPRHGNDFAGVGAAPAVQQASHQANPPQAASYFDQPGYAERSSASPREYPPSLHDRWADTSHDRAKRRLSTGKIVKRVLIGVAVVLGIPILAAIVIPVFLNVQAKDIADRTSIVMPTSILGMTKETGTNAQRLAAYYDTDLPAGYSHLSGIYSQADGDPGALIAIIKHALAPAHLTTELQAIERGFRSSVDSANSLEQFRDVDAGSLGGKMQCAGVTYKGVAGTVCAFGDAGAFGIITTYQPHDEAVILKLRAAVELRS